MAPNPIKMELVDKEGLSSTSSRHSSESGSTSEMSSGTDSSSLGSESSHQSREVMLSPGPPQEQPLAMYDPRMGNADIGLPLSQNLKLCRREISQATYTPESAIEDGMQMVKVLEESLGTLAIENKARVDGWKKDVQALMTQKPLTTLIAVCGATGVGKSSILNAVLEAKIVPTSGLQACTSVVTEISYHARATIVGMVDFLTDAEWKEEISILLSDLVGEEGTILSRPPIGTKTPAGVAWHKIQAVYPLIKFAELAYMTVEQVLALDHAVTRMLGTTKELASDSSEIFNNMIREYVDSSYQHREGDAGDANGTRVRPRQPAFWPLIRQVRILCNAKALSTGAVLVDLPGVGDANIARNQIAGDYMKKADCVWILAPIVRAVDDKVARDLLGEAFKLQLQMVSKYDDHSVTFVATKCDDIVFGEVVRALNLEAHPGYQVIEERIARLKGRLGELEHEKDEKEQILAELSRDVARLETEKETIDSQIEKMNPADPRGDRETPDELLLCEGTLKRKHGNIETVRPTKRQRCVNGEQEGDDEVLEERQAQCQAALLETFPKVSIASKKCREVDDERQKVQTEYLSALRQKYAFCSLERSKYSREMIIEDFREGLRELEDGDGERTNYESISPPVFTCSSRDFCILNGQSDNPGVEAPNCFFDIEDTGIPGLQRWCQRLTVASRERVARSFLDRLRALAASIQTYSRGISGVTIQDRAALQKRWESSEMEDTDLLVRRLRKAKDGVTDGGKPLLTTGITVQLCQEFSGLVDICVDNLKTQLRKGLSHKYREGATKASEKALATVDKFAASVAWHTYRATLRRDGVFHVDLNSALAVPFTKVIARSWASLFRKLSFRVFEDEVLKRVSKILEEVKRSATIGLQDRAESQSEACLEEVKVVWEQCLQRVKAAITEYQGTISRMMSPHVQKQLREGYKKALTECGTGKGSSGRRKELFRTFLDRNKERIFNRGSEIVMKSVDEGVESIGDVFDHSLEELAQKVEVNMSALWEVYHDDPAQLRARKRVADVAMGVCERTDLWIEIARLKNEKDQLEYDAISKGI